MPKTNPTKKILVPEALQASHEEILEWLKINPAFLLRHAKDLDVNSTAENVTPLHAVRAVRAEKSKASLEKKQERLMKTVEANSASAEDVFKLVPQLIRCSTLGELRKFVQTKLKTGLQIDAARLILADANTHAKKATATTMPAGHIKNYFEDGQCVVLRTLYNIEDKGLYGQTGKMLKSDALLHLQNSNGKTIGMLAIASYDETSFHPGQGAELATFLAKVVSAVLEKF